MFSSSLAQAYTLAGQLENAREEYTRILNLRYGIDGYNDLVTISQYRLESSLKISGRTKRPARIWKPFSPSGKTPIQIFPKYQMQKKGWMD